MGGALDAHLADPDAEFPFDARGKPTFRPSARWFFNQMDLHHSRSQIAVLDDKVTREGDAAGGTWLACPLCPRRSTCPFAHL